MSKAEKTKKGPADYKPTRKYKVPGNYTYNSQKEGFLTEVSVLSLERPGPNKYEPKMERKSQMKRSPGALLNSFKSERDVCLPYKKTDAPSPHSYAAIDKTWKMQSGIVEIAQKNMFKKDKTATYLDVVCKQKAFVPGVAKYKLDNDKILSKGPLPRYKTGR